VTLYWLASDEALQVRAARQLRGPIVAARGGRADVASPSPLTVEDGVATIRVEGLLTPTPDTESQWYGDPNTTYPALQTALADAMANKKAREIVWSIDSPGGAVDGLFALLDDIAEARASGGKPMRVLADNAHSAAYGIAAAVGRITATGRMSSFGSVGVATSAFVLGDMIGKVVHLTNSDAPEKRPEVATPEGRAVVTRYLDQIASEFMGVIAKGRGVPVGEVASSYGRGSSMLASAALAAKLIDDIAPRASGRTLAYANGHATVGNSMADQPAPEAPESEPGEAEHCEEAPESNPREADAAPEHAPAEGAAAAASAARIVTEADYAELVALRAERAERETAERRSLVTALVELGAETPATAWSKDAPVARLAVEPLADLRSRVAALRLRKPAADHMPPPAGSGMGEEALEDLERADAAKIKDPDARARFVASRLARKQKAQNHG
jgi:ClpP class serine protease